MDTKLDLVFANVGMEPVWKPATLGVELTKGRETTLGLCVCGNDNKQYVVLCNSGGLVCEIHPGLHQ